ncbi:MAG: DUF3243 family protein [Bacillota bacterium]|nr:DUF3243 family protein [Bacillota bacterium]
MVTDVDLGTFPKEVSEVIRDGIKHGVSDEQMIKGMISIGNLMGRFVKPDTPEEALMKEMWEVADESEKETIAKLVLKVGKRRVH